MRSLIAMIMALAFTAGNVSSALAASVAPANDALKPKKLVGKIIKETKTSDTETDIEVQSDKNGDGEQEIVILHISPSTYVANAETGQPISITDRKSDSVVVYYGPIETRSLPPQSNAVAVISDVKEGSNPPVFATVEDLNSIDDGGVKVLSDGGSVWVTIGKDTPISPFRTRNIVTTDDIDKGTDLLLWYNQVAMSFPAQATATKAVILGKNSQIEPSEEPASSESPEPSDVPDESVAPDGSVTPEETVASEVKSFTLPVDETYTEKKIVMVPLRVVVEGLGYVVGWDDEQKKVTVAKGTDVHLLNIGNQLYDQSKLSVAPVIKDEKTFVPIEYFEKILGATYEVNEDVIEFSK
jgi:hypothetical protein